MGEPVDVFNEGRGKSRPVGRARSEAERALARFAASRDGIVTSEDLAALGIGSGAIEYRAKTGRLHRLHQGVYALGHPAVTERGRMRAGVAACGGGAVLSHRSAARLWGLPAPPGPGIEVTVPSGRRRRRGLRVHRSRCIREADRTELYGIPVTTVARTLADLAGTLTEKELERAVIESERKSLLDVDAGLEACGRGRRGAALLRSIIERELAPLAAARSELELRFQALCRRFEIPPPQVNVRVEGFLVDAYWPEARLVVELDGDNYHRTAGDRRRDAARDRALASEQVLRFGWDDVDDGAEATAEQVLAMLARRSGRPFP